MSAIKNIVVPELGGATDVEVIEISVKPGDTVAANATLVTLESDKTTMEVPSSFAGVVKELKIKVGSKVNSGDVLLTLATEDAAADVKSDVKPAESAKAAPAEVAAKSQPGAIVKESQSEQKPAADVHAGPGVRRMARELGIDLTAVAGSGPKQRILKEDVQAFTQSNQGAAAPVAASLPKIDFTQFGEVEIKALTRIKKLSGKNLQRNWNLIPHVTQFAEADITEMEAFRQSRKSELEKQGVKLTPLVFIMKAVATALNEFPSFNASLDNSGDNLILKKYINIGVAVDTPEGLVVPVVRDVDKKGLGDLARELAMLSEKARSKKLAPADMQGGCFSISSLGGIGGTAFTPIVNYPEVAILGVSKAAQKPIFQDNVFVPRLMLPLSLSYDHRVIDGAEGARFIVRLAEVLSDIRNLLI